MEINFFLDSQQVEFENLMADLRLDLKDGQDLELTASMENLMKEIQDEHSEHGVEDTDDAVWDK